MVHLVHGFRFSVNSEEPLIESDMTFGPFPAGHCFSIEKSTTYRKIGNGVKIAEFLLLKISEGKPPVIWIVEAKSSAPRHEKEDRTIVLLEKLLT